MLARALLLLTILALALVSPAPMQAWQLDELALIRVPAPAALQVLSAETDADLDGDGALEMLDRAGDRAAIQTGGEVRWRSPEPWEVTQAEITDLNRDGLPEVALLVWRPFEPWPVDEWLPNGGRISSFHDSEGRSCHIILIGWKQDAFRELWAGSALAQPVDRFAAVDLGETGKQYLVTLEAEYDDPPSAPARRLKVWEWNGFGFTVVNELRSSFNLMAPAQTEDGRILIITD